ncbi:MAG TPA: hypothetical protein VHO28_09220 [Ignavibacteriales bacterium]|nr:hypothetical protein [Ignavibacteriales bacterium]
MQNKKEQQESGLDFLLVKTTAQKPETKKASKPAAPKGRTAATLKTGLMTKLEEYAKKHKKDVQAVLDEAVDSYLKKSAIKVKK